MAPQTEADAPQKKRCPFCAEEILAEAKKCRYCGEFQDTASLERAGTEQKRRIAALIGSVLLAFSPFTPLVSAPFFGRFTLFQQGKGDGVLILVAALTALGFAWYRRYGFQWVSGLLGLISTVNLFYVFWFKFPELVANYREQTRGNPFQSLGEAVITNVEPDWGAAVLLIGTALSLGVAVSLGIKRVVLTWSLKIGLLVALLYGVYRVLLIFFPYLAYWPSLLFGDD